MKKSKLLLSLASVSLLAGLTGCGTVQGATYTKGTPVKVGLICLHDSESTYDANFINALKEAVKNLGDKVTFEENCLLTGVAESQDCYDAAKDLVKKGCNVIFADSFGHQEFMLKAAKEWPTVQFCHATGTNAKTANLKNYHNAFASIYEGRYLAGYAAGLRLIADFTVANPDSEPEDFPATKVGYVGAFTYAEVVSGYTAWFQGVRGALEDNGADPSKVTMDVQFTGSWYDQKEEASAADALIKRGAVLVSQHADSMGAPGTCETAGIPNVTYNIETGDKCPNTYLAYSRINWAPYYENVVKSMFDGKEGFEGEKNSNWTGTLATKSVEYNVNWNNVAKNYPELAKEIMITAMKTEYSAVELAISTGVRKVFDTSKFTLSATAYADAINAGTLALTEDGHVTKYLADTDGDFAGDTDVIVNNLGGVSFFNESYECSAPYFDLRVEGINLLNEKY